MAKVTIEDISRHTGLSRGTVSRALNDRPDISEPTKQRVLEACRQLSYVPSHAARALATGRSYAVTVVVDDLRSAFAGCYLRGVLGRAQSQRYAVHVCELGVDPHSAIEHLRLVANERVDGVLLAAPLGPELAGQIAEALGSHPVVAVWPQQGISCDVFAPDYTESGRLVARHIIRQRTPDILYVHESGSEAAAQRLAGFRQVCQAQGLDPNQTTIDIGPGGPERLEALRPRLASLRALAASDDFLAVELMVLCYRAGHIPGRDIALMGQGNDLAGLSLSPSLTTVDPCGEEVGRRAMEMALQRITKSRQDAPQQTQVTPQLIARESTQLLS